MTLTIFNCGTGYHRNSNDVVSALYHSATSAKYVNDGPGGKPLFQFKKLKVPDLRGLLAGKGVAKNVANAVEEIKNQNANGGLVVNMLGWSRGAVTCFKIANALFQDPSVEATNLRLNIFAIDPVPGGGAVNDHMWEDIEYTPNIKFCEVIFAQHDHRGKFFSPYLPNTWFADVDIMPGNHANIVEAGGRNLVAHRLVGHLARTFLEKHGTVFGNNLYSFSLAEILQHYATIYESYNQYQKNKNTNRIFKKQRALRSADKKRQFKMLAVKPPLFVNYHHKQTFKSTFPADC